MGKCTKTPVYESKKEKAVLLSAMEIYADIS
jgi:hypothetical protein